MPFQAAAEQLAVAAFLSLEKEGDNSLRNRRYLFFACFLLVLILGLSRPAYAETVKKAIVTTAVLNVRTGPSTSYERIGSVTENTVLPVLSEQNGWVQICLPDGRIAWVCGDYVTITEISSSLKARVTTNVLNVRTGPSTDYDRIGTVTLGTVLPVQYSLEEWLLVKLPDGRSGWISGTYAELVYTENTAKGSKIVVDASALNVREGPSTNHPVIAVIPQGTVADILAEENDWIQVRLASGKVGWVAGRYVSVKPSDSGEGGGVDAGDLLSGKVIVIDPGHGGTSTGAIGPTGLLEMYVVLDVGLRLAAKLSDAGATVILTRNGDRTVSLESREKMANSAHADLFVSIHANAHPSSLVGGTETYYYKGKATSTSSFQAAVQIQNELVKALGLRNIGVKHGNFHVIRETKMPAVLVEIAFLSNPKEEALLKTADFREASAKAIFAGILNYFSFF